MTFIDIDSAQFYQPSNIVGLCSDGRPAVSDFRLFTARAKDNNPGAFRLSKKLNKNLQGYG